MRGSTRLVYSVDDLSASSSVYSLFVILRVINSDFKSTDNRNKVLLFISDFCLS